MTAIYCSSIYLLMLIAIFSIFEGIGEVSKEVESVVADEATDGQVVTFDSAYKCCSFAVTAESRIDIAEAANSSQRNQAFWYLIC